MWYVICRDACTHAHTRTLVRKQTHTHSNLNVVIGAKRLGVADPASYQTELLQGFNLRLRVCVCGAMYVYNSVYVDYEFFVRPQKNKKIRIF